METIGRAGWFRSAIAVTFLAGAALAGACGSDDASGDVVTEPAPSTWCDGETVPQAVAYGADGEGVRWVSCADEPDYRSLLPVTDGVLYVAEYGSGVITEWTALDAATGEPIDDAPPPPPSRSETEGTQRMGQPARVDLGDVTIIGGQDDPTRATFADGREGWTQPGVWTYDDVWAIDDDAVFAFEHESSRLVAYEIETGEVRWAVEGDPYAEGLWPWHAADGRLFTAWSNLQVRSTSDGELVWRTGYPAPAMGEPGPRISGVETDGTSVFVSFATEPSAGD